MTTSIASATLAPASPTGGVVTGRGKEHRQYYLNKMSLRSLFERAGKFHPDTVVRTRIAGNRYHSITYRQHQERCELLASGLTALGIRAGEVIGTFMWNNSRHLQAYHAVPVMGCVLHTLNIRLHPEKLNYIIQHAGDTVLIVDQVLLKLLSKVPREAFRHVKLFIICGRDETSIDDQTQADLPLPQLPPSCRVLSYEKVLGLGRSPFQWPQIEEDAPMALCYTSGTTGRPKGVMYSHKSQYLTVLGNLSAGQQGFRSIDTALPVVPMFHAMAWGIPYAALAAGCGLVLTNEHTKPDMVADMVLDNGVTVLSGVPTIWQGLQRALKTDPERYRPIKGVLRRGTVGGSKFSLELLRWFWDKWGVEVLQTWGMTETNPLGTAARRLDGHKQLVQFDDSHLDTAGRPVLGVDAKIVDPKTKKEAPHDGKTVGELLVRGPTIVTAYYKKIGGTKKSFVDGWLDTGDLASISPGGYVCIHDRSKDVIKSGGEWISSIDMENHIREMPGVKYCCVIGVPHPKWDERPIAVVELEDQGIPLSLKAVRSHCSKIFAKFQLPDDLLVWKSVPVSGTGKIDKKIVRAKLKSEGYVHPQLKAHPPIQSKL